ncbi:hypothetical protein CVIRNUC_010298 [Coccomyxa viridis]|uniref:Protein kinase domain-containing protein n=1 Tax=Coccomyxa viridis TaxID=1274662 RepID=A0AAV1IIL3_9CHLO|nr:hypothetical protein CVIRNUC_010298 [Coccomyxa viridis]
MLFAMTSASALQVSKEIRLHSRGQHQNIIGLYAAFQDSEGIYLVMECAAETVHQLLGRCGGYLLESAAQQQGILHRDIKPENVLLAADGTVRLCDFGLAMDLTCETPKSCMAEVCLARGASAAEGQSMGVSYGLPTDIWALGVLACELLTGASPFEGDTKEETYGKILDTEVWLPSHLSPEAQDFVRQALRKDPSQRPIAAEMAAHPWLKG